MKLIYKILLLTFLPLFAIMALILGVHSFQGMRAFQRQANALLDSELSQMTFRFEAFFEPRTAVLEHMTRLPLAHGDGAEQIVRLLSEQLRASHGLFESLYYLDDRGLFHAADASHFTLPDEKLAQALEAHGVAVSSLMLSRKSSRPIVVLLVAVPGKKTAVGGAIVMDDLLREVSRFQVAQSGFALLTGGSGRLLAGRGIRPPVGSRLGLMPSQVASEGVIRELAAQIQKIPAGRVEIELKNKTFVVAHQQLPVTGWKLAVVRAKSDVLVGTEGLIHTALFIPGLLLAMVLVMGYGMNRALLRPLRTLIMALRKLGSGDLSTRSSTGATGEIGELEASFNRMADRLHSELQAHAQAAKALRESENRYRTLVELSPVPIIVHSDGIFLYVNPAAVALHNASCAEELIGEKLEERVHPDDLEVLRDSLNAQTEHPTHAHLRIRRLDGSLIHIEATRITAPFGGFPAKLVLCADVTERKHMEKERRRLEEKVQHGQKLESLGLLAGGIAHDFNNMLAAILGNAELALCDLAPDSLGRDNLKQLELAAVRAGELTSKLLAYSGKGQFVTEPLNLGDIVIEVRQILDATVTHAAEITSDIEDEGYAFDGDPTQIRQLVMNLITNAAEAMEAGKRGEIFIRTEVKRLSADFLKDTYLRQTLLPGKYVSLEVRDDGMGMDEETISRIFDPFFSTKFIGRGLGLAAVIGIVRGHGGAIKVDSSPGSGTTFTLAFPCYEKRVAPTQTSQLPLENWSSSGTVLLADDEREVAAVVRAMLERAGFDVVLAENGKQAVEQFERHKESIVLVVLDLTMPRMNGRQALIQLRSRAPHLKIILCSGFNEEQVFGRFKEPPNAFLQKPFTMKKLISTVRTVLEDDPT